MLEAITQQVILPAHQRFAESAVVLDTAVQALADSPSEATLAAGQQAWRDTAVAAMPLKLYEMGPLQDQGLYAGFVKWPVNATFIEQYIAGSEPLDAQFAAGTGSTSKGLPALEYLLFDEAGNNAATLQAFQEARRAEMALALAEDLAQRAERLNDEWAAYADAFASASDDNSELQSSVSMLTNRLIATIESLAESDLGTPLGRSGFGVADPNLVRARRSDSDIPMLQARLEAVRTLFNGAGDGPSLADYLDSRRAMHDGQPLSAAINAQLDATEQAVAAIPTPLQAAIADDPDSVRAAYDQLVQLLTLVKSDMAANLGVTVTFSESDGD